MKERAAEWMEIARRKLAEAWNRSQLLKSAPVLTREDITANGGTTKFYQVAIATWDEFDSRNTEADIGGSMRGIASKAEKAIGEAASRRGGPKEAKVHLFTAPNDEILHTKWIENTFGRDRRGDEPQLFIGENFPHHGRNVLTDMNDRTWLRATGYARRGIFNWEFVPGSAAAQVFPGACGVYIGAPKFGGPDGIHGTGWRLTEPQSVAFGDGKTALHFLATPEKAGWQTRPTEQVIAVEMGAMLVNPELALRLELIEQG